MFEHLGHATYRWRWPIILVWLTTLLAGAGIPIDGQSLILSLPGRLQPGGFFDPTLEATRAQMIVEDELGQRGDFLVIIFHHPELTVDDTEYVSSMNDVLASLQTLSVVESVFPPTINPRQVSADRHTAFAVLTLSAQAALSPGSLDQVSAVLQPGPLRTIVAGGPVVYRDIIEVSERDLRRAEVISLPLALAALVIVFGSLVAAGLPVVIGAVSVGIALTILALLTRVTELSIFVLNLSTMLGLGLGTDYSLFIVSRFREELDAAINRPTNGGAHLFPVSPSNSTGIVAPVEAAVARTMATAGRAVLYSGSTVCIGLLGLASMRFMMLRSLGIGGAVVVVIAVAAALTLLPAMLAVLGERVNALPVLRKQAQRRAVFWHRLAHGVMRRPGTVIVLVLCGIGVLGTPFLRARFSLPDAAVLPTDMPSRQGYDLIREQFGDGEVSQISLVVRAAGPILSPERLDALFDLSRHVAADPEVTRVESIVDLDPRMTRDQYQLLYRDGGHHADAYARAALERTTRGNTTVLTVIPKHIAVAPEATALVERLRSLRPGADLEMLVGGGPAAIHDIVAQLYRDFPRAIVFILVTTYLALLVLLRSVILPLKAILMNGLSLVASYGVLVVVFQEGFLSDLFGFTPLGYVEATLPIIMFCLLFGLSMDYEVFLLSRIREAYDAGSSNTASVVIGLEQSGKVITNAALIVVLVSLSFVSADIILIKALGLGTAIAVFVDATIIRALLVPATMRVLGNLNWWAPSWIAGDRRRAAHVSTASEANG